MKKKDKEMREVVAGVVKMTLNAGILWTLQKRLQLSKDEEEIKALGKEVDKLVKEIEEEQDKLDKLNKKGKNDGNKQ